MTRVLFFVRKPEIREYRIQGNNIKLLVNEKIFPPSPHGSFFAENVKVNPKETVIDIGTGSGILAITAAKMGGIVYATDSDEDAVKLAEKNAKKNNVDIRLSTGKYFADFGKKFDVIIENLPQEIVHKSYLNAIGDKLSRTIDGGPDGNSHVLQFLDIARLHMHRNSRAYVIVNTVTDYASTIKKIISNYDAKLVAFDSADAKEFVEDNIEWYSKLNDVGKIKIFSSSGIWKAYEYLFELTLKKKGQ